MLSRTLWWCFGAAPVAWGIGGISQVQIWLEVKTLANFEVVHVVELPERFLAVCTWICFVCTIIPCFGSVREGISLVRPTVRLSARCLRVRFESL